MRMALLESGFWFGNALRAAGLPYGAVGAAVKMAEWVEAFHGLGVACLDAQGRVPLAGDAGRMRIAGKRGGLTMIDAGGQSALMVGPVALDLAIADARKSGAGQVSIANLTDYLWLGQLAELAAGRGFACALGFQAEGPEMPFLETHYSAGRSIVAVPAEPGPWWLELDAASKLHGEVMRGEVQAIGAAAFDGALVAENDAPVGVSLLCAEMDTPSRAMLKDRLLALDDSQRAQVKTSDETAEIWRRVREDGFDVDAEAWRRVANWALTTVVPSSETSRHQAGAD